MAVLFWEQILMSQSRSVLNFVNDLSIKFSPTLQVEYVAYKKTGNDYKMMPFKYGPKSVCAFTAEEENFYPDVVAVSNFPPIPSCDFKKDIAYNIINYVPDISKLPKIFESGKFTEVFYARDEV